MGRGRSAGSRRRGSFRDPRKTTQVPPSRNSQRHSGRVGDSIPRHHRALVVAARWSRQQYGLRPRSPVGRGRLLAVHLLDRYLDSLYRFVQRCVRVRRRDRRLHGAATNRRRLHQLVVIPSGARLAGSSFLLPFVTAIPRLP